MVTRGRCRGESTIDHVSLRALCARSTGEQVTAAGPTGRAETRPFYTSPQIPSIAGRPLGALEAGARGGGCAMSEGVSTRHALELHRDGFTPTRLNGRPPERSTVHRLDGPFSAEVDDGGLLDAVVGFHDQTLLIPRRKEYLACAVR